MKIVTMLGNTVGRRNGGGGRKKEGWKWRTLVTGITEDGLEFLCFLKPKISPPSSKVFFLLQNPMGSGQLCFHLSPTRFLIARVTSTTLVFSLSSGHKWTTKIVFLRFCFQFPKINNLFLKLKFRMLRINFRGRLDSSIHFFYFSSFDINLRNKSTFSYIFGFNIDITIK